MKCRFNRCFLVLVILLGAVSLASADEIVSVFVDGKRVNFRPEARVRAGTTYAPLRAAAQAVGADVKWEEAIQTAVVCTDTGCAMIKKQDGIIVNGSLLIPVRLMSQALGCEVRWDPAARAVRIRTPSL